MGRGLPGLLQPGPLLLLGGHGPAQLSAPLRIQGPRQRLGDIGEAGLPRGLRARAGRPGSTPCGAGAGFQTAEHPLEQPLQVLRGGQERARSRAWAPRVCRSRCSSSCPRRRSRSRSSSCARRWARPRCCSARRSACSAARTRAAAASRPSCACSGVGGVPSASRASRAASTRASASRIRWASARAASRRRRASCRALGLRSGGAACPLPSHAPRSRPASVCPGAESAPPGTDPGMAPACGSGCSRLPQTGHGRPGTRSSAKVAAASRRRALCRRS
ncbi:Uncharacterised protein [Mycobacteroides abscessus subsp. abscessus]|nr:Uncharacterised protein [Mycobacteroides abscessus subsp. abscessus]